MFYDNPTILKVNSL